MPPSMSASELGVPPPSVPLPDRLAELRRRIALAAEKSGRSADAVVLVAVTKTVAVERIVDAVRAGVTEIGENRVQEAEAKRSGLTMPNLRHHMIGHLQTNKARKALELFDVIQSVDSPKLALTLDRVAAELGRRPECLIEVKVSGEPTKTGLSMDEADDFLSELDRYPALRFTGLMTVAPFDRPETETREAFRALKRVFDRHRGRFGERPVLSMGMTDDFEWAVEEGSTRVRIGRGLFGPR